MKSTNIAPIIRDDELCTIETWNNTENSSFMGHLLHELVSKKAKTTPTHTAASFQDNKISFSELNTRANQCAHFLRSLGTGPDVVVAVMMERSIDLVIALLGVLKAGGAYLPIDPNYPRERMNFMMDDAGVSIVLSQENLKSRIVGFEGTIFCLDSEHEHLIGEPSYDPDNINSPNSLAYVIYTSGSTGKPKGCMISHEAICNRLLWMQDQYTLTNEDKVLQKTPFTFDVSVWEFFLPLISGSEIVLARPEGHKDAEYLVDLICKEKITVCHFVPSMLSVFINNSRVSSCQSLKYVFTSGEALSKKIASQCMDRCKAQLINLYGPTEAAVDVTYYNLSSKQEHVVPIGRPITNVKLYILDEGMNHVPIGHDGQLYIGGIALARGYLNRPELTKDRFVYLQWDNKAPVRLYKTGDKARFLEDGNIEYLGRIDRQVKLRGNRIELGEIEVALLAHTGISQSAVMLQDELSGDPKLVAYVLQRGEKTCVKELRSFLKTKLPDFMVPNFIVHLDQLPTTLHGKLDYQALPWPIQIEKDKGVIDQMLEVSNFETVKELMTVHVTSILSVNQIDLDEDLFDLGATSLTMMQVAIWIQEAFGVTVPMDVFLEDPSIGALSKYICLNSVKPVLRSNPSESLETVGNDVNTTSTLQTVLDILIDKLHVSQLSETDDVFEFGATSLTMMQIAEAVQNRYHVAVPIEILLEGPSATELAKYIDSQNSISELSPKNDDFSISFKSVSELLGLLAQVQVKEQSKYLYPSTGGLYSVQTYFWASNNAVAQLDEGFYYYNPVEHSLVTLHDAKDLGIEKFNSIKQFASHSSIEIAIFFVVDLDAIEPIYQQGSPVLAALDVGYIRQLLISRSSQQQIELQTIHDANMDGLRHALRLSERHILIHCLGGRSNSGRIQVLSNEQFNTRSLEAPLDSFLGSLQLSGIENWDKLKFLNSQELKQFYANHHLVRMDLNSNPSVQLLKPIHHPELYSRRSARRDYLDGRISYEKFLSFLSVVKHAVRMENSIIDDKQELQVYVYVKKDRIKGLEGGVYVYDLNRNCLHQISEETEIPRSIHTPSNRSHYQKSAFCIYLISELSEDNILQSKQKLYQQLLNAGSIGQVLMEKQSDYDLGLCPVGGMKFNDIRHLFKLKLEQHLLHSFIGGPCDNLEQEHTERKDPVDSNIEDQISVGTEASDHIGDIAIVGIAGRYPGASDLSEFWSNILDGKSCIKTMSNTRKQSLWQSDSAPNSFDTPGGYLEEVSQFDNLLFNISNYEAKLMDPQERLLLESAWECLENAGYTSSTLMKEKMRIGVFIGAMWNEYQNHSGLTDYNEEEVYPSSFHATLANRISYFFNFTGPSVAFNTSCSSSMTALHYACESIQRGECDIALVGGVNVITHSYHLDYLKSIHFLADNGISKPFAADSTGWLAGEGVGTVLIRRLTEAEEAGDHIHAVIKGTTLFHTGRTARFGAPSVESMVESMQQMLRKARIEPEAISYVEAAAAGAIIADAAEMNAIARVFETDTESNHTFVGSIKGNIGHLESASTMSQLTKVLLQMKNSQLAPTIHYEPVNPMIQQKPDQIKIVSKPLKWEHLKSQPCQILINSFGATGSGGHVIIEEYVSRNHLEQRKDSYCDEVIIPISSPTPSLLYKYVEEFKDFMVTHSSIRIHDLALTLQQGRNEFKERLAIVTRNTDDLISKLDGFLKNDYKGIYVGTAEVGKSGTKHESNSLGDDARKWVEGASINWDSNFKIKAKRIPIPTPLPFQRNAFWYTGGIEEKAANSAIKQQVVKEELTEHPVVRESDRTLQRAMEAYFKRVISEVSEIAEANIDSSAEFSAYGLNSILITRLNGILEKAFGNISKTLFFEYGTIRELAKYFTQNYRDQCYVISGETDPYLLYPSEEQAIDTGSVASSDFNEKTSVVVSDVDKGESDQDIVIIGVAGTYPMANNIQEFWDNLSNGVDCITEIPKERWDYTEYFSSGKAYSKWGGFIQDVDKFDPLFFSISPREAEIMDPQERLFLQIAWHTLEDAGYNREEIQKKFGGSIGVFVGVMYGEYQLLNQTAGNQDLSVVSSYGSIANRVSYTLDFNGPSMAIDTLCSSSLTALHQAVESIRRGECKGAIVGGVNLSLHPSKYILHSQMSMSSTDGRCRSFGKGGTGFVPGEGVGALLLKPLSAAVRDKDQIYGVIKGTSINHGGKTNGYTVPSPRAQGKLILDNLQKSNIDPSTLSYVEAHGTGTSLGDPIEIEGLSQAFEQFDMAKQVCSIGSVKSNIGHLEAAAGVAGITKVLLQMQHKKLAPSLHAGESNENIDFPETPFYVQQTFEEWLPTKVGTEVYPRRATVSSFGAGGANAHVVLEEHKLSPANNDEYDGGQQLIVLSAKNKERLREYARNLASYVKSSLSQLRLHDIAYTLQVGRDPMEERLACVVNSIDQLVEQLESYINGQSSMVLHKGNTKEQQSSLLSWLEEDEDLLMAVDSWIVKGKHNKLAQLWANGHSIDWDRLHRQVKSRRISLPCYPFEKERYWIHGIDANEVKNSKRDHILKSNPQITDNDSAKVMLFQEEWIEQAVPDLQNRRFNHVICFLSDPLSQTAFAEALKLNNPSVNIIFVSDGAHYKKHSSYHYEISSITEMSFELLLDDIRKQADKIDGCFYFWPLENRKYVTGYSSLTSLFKAVKKINISIEHILLAAYYNCDIDRCYIESWIGYEKSLTHLFPDTTIRIVMKKYEDEHIGTWADIANKELQSINTKCVRYEGNKRYVNTIQPKNIDDEKGGILKFIKGATYLITGGCGGLGFEVARYLAKEYKTNLILTGRSPINKEMSLRINMLNQSGGKVYYIQADLTDVEAMKLGLQEARASFGSIQGVIHAAGVIDNRSIFEKNTEDMDRVLKPKVDGTLILNELLREEKNLDFVCFFSSTSAILGDFGACDYAIANRFLMSFAHHRNQEVASGEQSGRTIAFCWPVWRDGGMSFGEGVDIQTYLNRSHQKLLETKDGITIMENLLGVHNENIFVLYGESASLESLRIAELGKPSVFHSPTVYRKNNNRQHLMNTIKTLVSSILKIPLERIEEKVKFSEYGFDSITLMDLTEELNREYHTEIGTSDLYEYSSIEELVNFMLTEFNTAFDDRSLSDSMNEEVEHVPIEGEPNYSNQDTAIIGISGRFPKSNNLDDLWENIVNGNNCITEVPSERWDWREHTDSSENGDSPLQWGGFMDNIDEFDPEFFGILPEDVKDINPEQRLVLIHVWKALEDAGIPLSKLAGTKTGVFIAAGPSEYNLIQNGTPAALTTIMPSFLPNRISYWFNLVGPSEYCETACSSSVVAIHRAVQSLENKECEVAIVASINLLLSPTGYKNVEAQGNLSSEAHVWPFQENSKGYVRSEGVGAVILKPLLKAQEQKDSIYAVIKGSAVSHGGKGMSMTAPNLSGMKSAMIQAYHKGNIDPRTVSYIEAHGTASGIGDSIEIRSLKNGYKELLSDSNKDYPDNPCYISTLKPVIGHGEMASGMAALFKVIYSLRKGLIPGIPHFKEVSDEIPLKGSPFQLVAENHAWTRNIAESGHVSPRRASINSYGFGGVNAHLVLEEYQSPKRESSSNSNNHPSVIVFSGRNEGKLDQVLKQMLEFLEENRDISFSSLVYTLQEAREMFDYRAAIVAENLDELLHILREYVNTKNFNIQNLFVGSQLDKEKISFSEEEGHLNAVSHTEELNKIAVRWVKGENIIWNHPENVSKLLLPPYPLERVKFPVFHKDSSFSNQ
ncbi:amino acid adenylation domain-containing protein [Paenibacillus taichungensis]|uniref:amino acid adenylation domain-containing protein n=1 Tax=Paenibacillus taichungensis TaxID=484184 RepID=UPI0038CFC6FC